jgi:hypothetical protein
MTEWLRLASSRAVVSRALRYALGVGTLLIVINHSDAIARRDISPQRLFRMALTVTVPYIVSTASSVGAMRGHSRRADPGCGAECVGDGSGDSRIDNAR